MSAHRQEKAHVDALVTVAMTGKPSGCYAYNRRPLVFAHDGDWYSVQSDEFPSNDYFKMLTPTQLGKILWDENTASLNARYSDWPVDGEYGEFEPTRLLTLPEAVMAVSGYMYQACEHPDWTKSIAYAFCIHMKAELAGFVRGVSDADTWSIHEDDVRQIVAEPGVISLIDMMEKKS